MKANKTAKQTILSERNAKDCRVPGTKDAVDVEESNTMLQRLAVLGDSSLSLVASFALLVVAMAVQQWSCLQPVTTSKFVTYESLGPLPAIAPPMIYDITIDSSIGVLPPAAQQAYERDGVVCIRGLIDEELLEALDTESSQLVEESRRRRNQRKGRQFYTEEHSAIFRSGLNEKPSSFLNVSLQSNVARVAAELLLDPVHGTEQTMRLVRDIFLAKDDDTYVCGWHVDDLGFWPATPESPGINAWIALDDMENVEETGGFALAVQSDRAAWREAALVATGASTDFPASGYQSAADMLERRTGSGTCNLRQAAPHIDRRMEEVSRIYPVRRGDVVFHTRWLFHRTVAVNRSRHNDKVYRRYSVRYGPGSRTIVPPGFGTELSVLWDHRNGGRSLDQVAVNDGPWYPQAWPRMTEGSFQTFWNDFLDLRTQKLPIATERRKEHVKSLKRESQKRHRQKQKGNH